MKPKNVKVILQDEFRMNYVFTPPIHVQYHIDGKFFC